MHLDFLATKDWIWIGTLVLLYILSRVIFYKTIKLYKPAQKHQIYEGFKKNIDQFDRINFGKFIFLNIIWSLVLALSLVFIRLLAIPLYDVFLGFILTSILYDINVSVRSWFELRELAHSNYFEGQITIKSPFVYRYLLVNAGYFVFFWIIIYTISGQTIFIGSILSSLFFLLNGFLGYRKSKKIRNQ